MKRKAVQVQEYTHNVVDKLCTIRFETRENRLLKGLACEQSYPQCETTENLSNGFWHNARDFCRVCQSLASFSN